MHGVGTRVLRVVFGRGADSACTDDELIYTTVFAWLKLVDDRCARKCNSVMSHLVPCPVCAVGAMHAVCVLRCNLFVPSAPVADKTAGILQVCTDSRDAKKLQQFGRFPHCAYKI